MFQTRTVAVSPTLLFTLCNWQGRTFIPRHPQLLVTLTAHAGTALPEDRWVERRSHRYLCLHSFHSVLFHRACYISSAIALKWKIWASWAQQFPILLLVTFYSRKNRALKMKAFLSKGSARVIKAYLCCPVWKVLT